MARRTSEVTIPAATGSIREGADRTCRFRPIKGGGFRVALEVTRRCNLACLHCFVPNEPRDPALPRLLGLLRALAEFGGRKVILTGGEPLLRPDLEEIIRTAAGAGMGVDLNSNLLDLDDRRADALVAAGLGEASVSFYGDRGYHDRFVRRPGAFDDTLVACERLRDRGVDLDVHGPVWADNLAFAATIYDLARSMGAKSLTLFRVIGLAGTENGRAFAATRFGAHVDSFGSPPTDELRRTIQSLREKALLPVRTIGFWGDDVCRECEQGRSILGLDSNLSLSPCLLSRRLEPLRRTVTGETLGATLEVLRDEVRRGLWNAVCAPPGENRPAGTETAEKGEDAR
jgi:MoaA/NifB/PqqE/SkfB family radical SAM enzyme